MGEAAESSVYESASRPRWLDSIALLSSPNPASIHSAPFVSSCIEPDQVLSEHELQRRVARGDVSAKVILGTRYLIGQGVNTDPQKGRRWLLEAAEQGSRLAHIELGVYCLAGWGMEPDREQGLRWLRRIGVIHPVELSIVAVNLYLRALRFSNTERRQLIDEACVLFQEAFRQGERDSTVNLAYLLRRGEIPPATYPSLDELLSEHLQQNKSFALANQALRLARGVQCAVDWTQADELISRITDVEPILSWWFRRSLDGDAEGHLVVGWLCRQSLAFDPERCSLHERLELARAGGWPVPQWMNRYRSAQETRPHGN